MWWPGIREWAVAARTGALGPTPWRRSGVGKALRRRQAMQIIKRPISADQNWPAKPRAVSWLIGAMASMITMTVVYVGWLGQNFSELKRDVSKIKAEVEGRHQSADAKLYESQTSVSNDVTILKSEVDDLKHNDSTMADKVVAISKETRN